MRHMRHCSTESRAGGSPWPDAKPHVIAWCPHKNRCRIGAVYATRWGYLWLNVERNETGRRERRGHSWEALGRLHTAHLSRRDVARNFGHMSGAYLTAEGYRPGCRHWTLTKKRGVPFIANEMLALLDDVKAGRIARPASYVAQWDHAVY